LRFPPGRVWFTKLLARAAAPAAAVGVYVLATVIHIAIVSTEIHGSGRVEAIQRLEAQLTPSLWLCGPVFGYALGHFLGLVCRKPAVAAVLATLTAAGVGMVWM